MLRQSVRGDGQRWWCRCHAVNAGLAPPGRLGSDGSNVFLASRQYRDGGFVVNWCLIIHFYVLSRVLDDPRLRLQVTPEMYQNIQTDKQRRGETHPSGVMLCFPDVS